MAQSYEIDIKRFNGQDYDTLLPTPASHASTHQADGSDPITMQTGNYANGSVTLSKIASTAFDTAPVEGSNKIITSGGVAEALANFTGGVEMVNVFNYADNSNFTQWVAQAGIGGNHGNQPYGGDRWILDSGTITGTARADGNGYENVTLNGTIRQIVANPPAVGTPFIEMVSGTATVNYANGEITITSLGGVIKNVGLYEGSYAPENEPKYQSKGYGTELYECARYYCCTSVWVNVGFGMISWQGDRIGMAIPTIAPMRKNPTVNTNLTFVIFYDNASLDIINATPAYMSVSGSAVYMEYTGITGISNYAKHPITVSLQGTPFKFSADL